LEETLLQYQKYCIVEMARASSKRIAKELIKIKAEEAALGLSVEEVSADRWLVRFVCNPDTIYAGESHTIQITFSNEYPIDSPEVIFLNPPPEHLHVYSNGHICLNILYDDWSPALTVQSVCLSLMSMLASATEKARPPDNAIYMMRCGSQGPKKTRFMYDDDTV
jgi:ubiquitin-conjugating enzyme E2 W